MARSLTEPGRGLLTYSGEGHLITFAPTGTGKTAGPVICNALTWPWQLIVLDIKGEVHRATAAAANWDRRCMCSTFETASLPTA
jgi:type IV secretory pathway TraG/TraD family ATPase VirD4